MTAAPDDECLRALAHPERRRLLRLCRDRALPAGELAAGADMSQAAVSEHLKVLRKTGLATVEKTGKFWLYRTNTQRLEQVLRWLRDDLELED